MPNNRLLPLCSDGAQILSSSEDSSLRAINTILENPDIKIEHKTDIEYARAFIDVGSTIKSFKKLLCDESNRDLQEHSVWLNNVQVLEPHIKLSELCIEQNGTVQINAQVCNQRINIVDIWKIPADSMHISEVQGTTTSLNMPNKFGHNIRLW